MAQFGAPENIVRAIVAASPSAVRDQTLAALGLNPDGTQCDDATRGEALSALIGDSFDPQDAAQQTLPATEEVAEQYEEELPF